MRTLGVIIGLLSVTLAFAKPTKSAPRAVPELAVQVIRSPREAQVLESTFMVDPGVQACLYAAYAETGGPFAVDFNGFISKKGGASKIQVKTRVTSLKTCLKSKLEQIPLGPGAQGLFRVKLLPIEPGSQLKTIPLSTDSVKKFE